VALQITGQSQPGIPTAAQKSGSPAALPTGWNGEQLQSDMLPRFSHLTQAGAVYSTGMQLTSISAATFTTADALSGTLGTAATATPIVGIWNPPSNSINAHILTLNLQIVVTALQATGCGGFVWVVFPPNNLITVASQAVPVNRKTFQPAGSLVRGLSGLALTGLANLGQFLGAAGVNGGAMLNLSTLQTAAGLLPPPSSAFEQIDGSIIVPPGGVLGLFCSDTPVAHSAAGSLTWAELPI
jgi:hypothetical protein